MLPALAIAAACTAWHPAAAGFYPGIVESQGPKRIDAWITEAPDGRLSGRYILHEPGRDVPGTLEPAADGACNEAWFRWTDLYGTGTARLQFHPDRHCFEGVWGAGMTVPTLPWTTCNKPAVTS